MSDLISRQAAIDAIEKLDIPEDMCVFEILSHIELEIQALPSAQPEPSQVARDIATIIENEQDMRVILSQPEIVRCKDCKYVGTDATCCLVCNREGMGLKPYHVRKDDYCSYAERRTDE